MPRVVACYSIKGGVGKTTTAVNMAWVAAAHGYRTLLWDLDAQGAASYCLRVKPKLRGGAKGLVKAGDAVRASLRGSDVPNLDLLPADFSLRKLDLTLDRGSRPRQRLREVAKGLLDEYDLLLLDCAPGLTLTSENVFRAADMLLVPVIPTPLSLRTVEQLNDYLHRKGPQGLDVRAFFSMADGRKALHKSTVATHLHSEPGMLRTVIPYASPAELMSVRRAPLGEFAPSHPVMDAYRRLFQAVRECG